MNPDVNEFNSLNDQNACSCQYYTIQEFLAAFQINANDKSANIPIISKMLTIVQLPLMHKIKQLLMTISAFYISIQGV